MESKRSDRLFNVAMIIGLVLVFLFVAVWETVLVVDPRTGQSTPWLQVEFDQMLGNK